MLEAILFIIVSVCGAFTCFFMLLAVTGSKTCRRCDYHHDSRSCNRAVSAKNCALLFDV